jgi:hypothetical protein
MSFEARLYIQGAGVYVPHDQKDQMLVLFPSYEQAAKRNILDPLGKPVCRHYTVAQLSSRCLESALVPRGNVLPDMWTSIDLSGMWIGFSARSAGQSVPTRLLTSDRRVPGVPSIPEILRTRPETENLDSALDRSVWPGEHGNLLKAGLLLNAGILSPSADFEGLFRFDGLPAVRRDARRQIEDERYSSVLKLELGEVESLTLHFRPFGSDKTFDISVNSPWDELDVWIRHFCEIDRPDLQREMPETGEADIDFVLNYALLQELEEILAALNHRLPVPNISTSWERGGLIGGEARKCMGASSSAVGFNNPIHP